MNDNDMIMIYEMLYSLNNYVEISLTEEQKKLIDKVGIIVEQINLSHEYRDKLNELNKKLQGCEEDAN